MSGITLCHSLEDGSTLSSYGIWAKQSI